MHRSSTSISSLFVAILEPSSAADVCMLLDLEHGHAREERIENLANLISHRLVILKDAKSFLQKHRIAPTPHQKIICLTTIKKLMAKDPDEPLDIPEFSSPLEALSWMEKKSLEAFLCLNKLNLDDLAKLECQVIPATIAMENKGIPFNKAQWAEVLSRLEEENVKIKTKLKDFLKKNDGFLLFGPDSVDLNNAVEVKHSLESLLGRKLAGISQSILNDIDHQAARLLLLYRAQTRMLQNYGEMFLQKIKNDRLRGHFVPLGSASGRFSCHDPNLLALPGHADFQSCMTPVAPYKILHFDYGAFELRVLSALSGDETLIKIFNDQEDIHSLVAQEIFKTKVSKTENFHLRDQAKVLNFGLIYGMGEITLARKLKISEREASQLLKNYFRRFFKVHQFLNDLEKEACATGYAKTALGRRAYLQSSERDHGHKARVAKNIPIQGTGADIVKLAMCRVYRRLSDAKLDAYLINVVHDELVIECNEEILDEVSDLVSTEMTEAFRAILPNVVSEVSVS